jgi:hypothetical protein
MELSLGISGKVICLLKSPGKVHLSGLFVMIAGRLLIFLLLRGLLTLSKNRKQSTAVGEHPGMTKAIMWIIALLALKSGLSRRMTEVSIRYYPLICKYCIHCKGGCLKDVPWYAVSLSCGFFEDGKPVKSIKGPGGFSSFRADDVLVDTV